MTNDTTASKIGEKSGHTDSGLSVPIADAADETVRVVSENVGLVIAGGLVIGLVAAALMPRSKKKKLAKRSRKISALVSDLGKALAAQAGDAASEGRDQLGSLSQSIGDTVSERSQEAGKKAGKLAGDVADKANDGGKAIARRVVKLIEKIGSQ